TSSTARSARCRCRSPVPRARARARSRPHTGARTSSACASATTASRSRRSTMADRPRSRPYERGLAEVGNGFYAYLQPDGGWGWSNAGLVVDGGQTLLVDTLFDLHLTERMLEEMRSAVPAAARIDTLVNTHANGDHCFGNQLLDGARIVASAQTAAEMAELPPAAMAALVEQAPQMGKLGEFFL